MKQFIVNRQQGKEPTLEQLSVSKIPIYENLAEVKNNLNSIEAGQIIGTKDYSMNSYYSNIIMCTNNIDEAKTITFPGWLTGKETDRSFRVLFVNGHNCMDDSTPLTLNGILVVSNKYGTLIPLPIHKMTENDTVVYKSLQSNTVLDMYYTNDYDGNNNPAYVIIGNPVVLSSTDYTIYADGKDKVDTINNEAIDSLFE